MNIFETGGFRFGMGSPLLYYNALKKSGFVSIKKITGTNGIKKKLEKNYKYYQVQLSLMRRLLQITLLNKLEGYD